MPTHDTSTPKPVAGPIETQRCAECRKTGPCRQITRTPAPGRKWANRGWLCYACADHLSRSDASKRDRWELLSLHAALDAWRRHKHASDIDVVSVAGRCARCGVPKYGRLVARQPTKRNPYARRRNRARICRPCLETVVMHIELIGDDPYWDPEAAKATFQAWPDVRGPRSSDRQPASTP